MKNNKRFLLGLLSSLFLACGFVGVANRLDPMNSVVSTNTAKAMHVADDCTAYCNADIS